MTKAFSPFGIFWILAAAFFLNDLLFIYWSGQTTLYYADYVTRLAVIAICFAQPLFREVASRPLSNERLGWLTVIAAIPVMIVLSRAAHVLIEPPLIRWLGYTGLFEFARIDSAALRLFDLTIGLLLVAISEELVFRKFALNWLRSAGFGVLGCILISALIFAAMHWGSGVHRVAATFVFGVIAMAFYMRHTLLWPLIIVHYAANLIAFGEF